MTPEAPGQAPRISVVGTAGVGKTTVARQLAKIHDVPHIELDELYHLPGWTPRPFAEMASLLRDRLGAGGWVVDGNYRVFTLDGLVWQEANTVVWVDLPRRTVMRQVLGRTLRRGLLRQELWNSNRERLTNLFRRMPEENIVLWAWSTYAKNVERYEGALSDPRFAHLEFVRLRSRAEIQAYVDRPAG